MAPGRASSSGWRTIGRKGRWQQLHIELHSDGEQRHWPPQPYRPSSEEQYLITLGRGWAEKLGIQQPGVEYYIDRLPNGFGFFEMDQPTGNQLYKRLFGHQSGKYYDSSLRFLPHFLWLMSGMEGNCECLLCGNVKAEPTKRRTGLGAENAVLPSKEKRKLPALATYDSDVSARSTSIPGRAGTSTRPQRQVRSAGAPYAQDAEGTEDIYKEQLKTLYAHKDSRKGIEDDIREPNSIDWRAEHSWVPPTAHDWSGTDHVQQSLTSIEHQHTFVPRVGELVLFCPTFLDQHYLMLDEEAQQYKFYSFDQKCFHGFPAWRAGVIATIPSQTDADGPIDFPDIQDLPKKQNSLNTSGFRVETFPDPNNVYDKTASKQYKDLPLRNIRPLNHWQMLLRGIPRTKWHPSIENALTCMTTISLLEKFYFKGDWDAEQHRYGVEKKAHASIRCKGVYIGAELITVGDAVRINPEQGKRCTDVLVVESIRLQLRDVKPEHVLPESPLLSTQTYITLVGKAYTINRARHIEKAPQPGSQPTKISPEEAKTIFRPVGAALYGPWYTLHGPQHRYEISHDQILGRMHEGAAVQLWTGLLQRKPFNSEEQMKPSLDYDLKGVEEGRVYAIHADERLAEAHTEALLWFWADTRAEALDVQTFNGIEVGRYDKTRDKETLELWRTHLKILNGHTVDTIASKFTNFLRLDDPGVLGGKRGRKPGAKLVDNKIIYPGDPNYPGESGHRRMSRESQSATQLTPSRHKGSQMAGAALVSTDEDSSNEEAFVDAKEDWGLAVDGPSEGPRVRYASPTPRQPQKQPKTKAEIMESAADEESYSDDDDWLNYPPPVRGGTQETEGGDYAPDAED
ncbi:hypothetical protein H2200_000559 [Cladophialophora chaetospira]|uniref:Cryptic loci regulator 2 N-terminal domain-containing protein n=1 Tax=Cladophialophora chaetospira TaxID=386627 RepID=A0AA39CPA6_9EURO|nr:hypothetical protein H2200_000559 [Cladophialophora chaetospira]